MYGCRATVWTGRRNSSSSSAPADVTSPEADAWEAVAGLTVGQDLSDRTVQNQGRPAQFNLGKSFAGYGPTGPAVVTIDEVRAVCRPPTPSG